MTMLTDEELILLDGKCGDKIQEKVEEAKKRLAVQSDSEHHDIIAAIVVQAEKDGELRFYRQYISYCNLCGEGTTYPKYTKGRNKGRTNYDKPLQPYGVQIAYHSLCTACWNAIQPDLMIALEDVKAEIPRYLTGYPPKYRKEYLYQCECGWIGRSGLLGRSTTLMGDGSYPSTCPQCGAQNILFGPERIKLTAKFEVVENE